MKPVPDTNTQCDFAEGLPDAVDVIAVHGAPPVLPLPFGQGLSRSPSNLPPLTKGGRGDFRGKGLLLQSEQSGLPLLPSVRTEILVDLLARGMDCRFTARGNSMRPLIKDGDEVVLSPFGNRPPRVGDVVSAVNPETGRLLVHRVIGKRPGCSLTKGDNAPTADGWFPDRDLPGRVTEVQRSCKLKSLGLGPEGLLVAALSRLGLFSRLTVLL